MLKDIKALSTSVRTARGALDIARREMTHVLKAGSELEIARAALDVAAAELDAAWASTAVKLEAAAVATAAAIAQRDEALATCQSAFREMHHRVNNILGIAAATARLHDKPGIDGKDLREKALARIHEIADEHGAIMDTAHWKPSR